MTKEEFGKLMTENAVAYATESVVDPEEHDDAVEAIITDYIEGGLKAYELLTGTVYE